MPKKTFAIEWPDDCGPEWMNVDNLMLCLNAYCKGVDLKVTEEADDDPDEFGPMTEAELDAARVDLTEEAPDAQDEKG